MLGILVHGDNHFIVSGPQPAPQTARALARHWSVISIGGITPESLQPWQIITRAFRENLEWAVVVPSQTSHSTAVITLLDELSGRGIQINRL